MTKAGRLDLKSPLARGELCASYVAARPLYIYDISPPDLIFMSLISRCRIRVSIASIFGKNLVASSFTAHRAFTYSVRKTAMDKAPDQKGSITDWVKPGDKSGEFKRQVSSFRSWIENKPDAEFPPEKGRYHLYVSYACPWAHRTMIVRKLKGLEDFVGITSVHWHMRQKGMCEYLVLLSQQQQNSSLTWCTQAGGSPRKAKTSQAT